MKLDKAYLPSTVLEGELYAVNKVLESRQRETNLTEYQKDSLRELGLRSHALTQAIAILKNTTL